MQRTTPSRCRVRVNVCCGAPQRLAEFYAELRRIILDVFDE